MTETLITSLNHGRIYAIIETPAIRKEPNDHEIYNNMLRSTQSFIVKAKTDHIISNQYLDSFYLANSPIHKTHSNEMEKQHIIFVCTANNNNQMINKLRELFEVLN